MTAARRAAALAAVLLASHGAGATAEPPCPTDPVTLERGETRRVLLCGSGLAGLTGVAAEDGSGITVTYQQPLTQCSFDRQGPGVYLALTAAPDARPAALRLAGAAGCPAVPVAVPDRVALPAATLEPHRGDEYTLTLRAPAGTDLRGACATPPAFPPGPGPRLAPAPGATPSCRADRYRLRVTARGEQREPAAVRLRGVMAGGAGTEAVAFVALPAPAWEDDMPEPAARFVTVAGVRTRYFTAGRGHPLLLVHGGQAGGTNNEARKWDQNFRGLARHFRVIAVDRLGQGGTANPPDPADYARLYAADTEHLLGFIRALGLRRVHLVGHSQGGYPVTRIAVDHPELVSCLVNVDTGIVPDSLALVKQTLPFLTYIASTAVPAGGPVPESIRREIALRTPSGHNITAAHIDRIWRLWQSPTHGAARAATRAAGMTPAGGYFRGLKAQLLADIGAGRLTVPNLLVWGRDDPQVPLVAGLELFALLDRGGSPVELAVIANAGHEVFMEYPADFNRIVTGFCAARE